MCCFFIQSPLYSNIPPLHCGQIVHKVNVMMGYIETEIFVMFEMGSLLVKLTNLKLIWNILPSWLMLFYRGTFADVVGPDV